MALTLLQIGVIYFLGHLFAYTFRRFKVPDVLLFMVLGLILGPVLGVANPDNFGSAGAVLSTLALVVILFESGTTLDTRSLAEVFGVGSLLTLLTFVATGILAFLISLPFTGGSLEISLLTGVILAGTSSAVVIPMATALGISEKPKNILILESALTDVLCIILALALTQTFAGGPVHVGAVFGRILLSFALALILGVVAGVAWAFVKEKLQAQFATIAFAILTYAGVELLGYSGPIAVMSMGVALANTHKFHKVKTESALTPVELGFYSELVFVLKTFFFIFLGISMRLDNKWVLPAAVVFMVALIAVRAFFVKRMLRLPYSAKESSYLTLLIPKGLAAAVLATVPMQAGLLGAEVIPQFVYPSVLVSIVIVSILIPFAGQGLKFPLKRSAKAGPSSSDHFNPS